MNNAKLYVGNDYLTVNGIKYHQDKQILRSLIMERGEGWGGGSMKKEV